MKERFLAGSRRRTEKNSESMKSILFLIRLFIVYRDYVIISITSVLTPCSDESFMIFFLKRKKIQVLSRQKEVKKISDLILLRLAVSIDMMDHLRGNVGKRQTGLLNSLSFTLSYTTYYSLITHPI